MNRTTWCNGCVSETSALSGPLHNPRSARPTPAMGSASRGAISGSAVTAADAMRSIPISLNPAPRYKNTNKLCVHSHAWLKVASERKNRFPFLISRLAQIRASFADTTGTNCLGLVSVSASSPPSTVFNTVRSANFAYCSTRSCAHGENHCASLAAAGALA